MATLHSTTLPLRQDREQNNRLMSNLSGREGRPAYQPPSYNTAGSMFRKPSPAPSTSSSIPSLTTGDSSSRNSYCSSSTDFDDLYDVSDDDSAVVPLRVSNSVKLYLSRSEIKHDSLPSLVIPSPAKWPTVEKLQKAESPKLASGPLKTPLSPAALARLQTSNLTVPGVHSAPSLDGSLTTDEAASISPSTPASQSSDWELPCQLDPRAMDTLRHLSTEVPAEADVAVVEVTKPQPCEMQERGLQISIPFFPLTSNKNETSIEPPLETPISAISIPSPGGFLAQLDSSSRQVWDQERQPSSATAESFYDLPWNASCVLRSQEAIVEEDCSTEGPPTARKEAFSPIGEVDEMIIKPRELEYDESYEKKLCETASSNMTRTSLWLASQREYIDGLQDIDSPVAVAAAPQTPKMGACDASITSPASDNSSPSKKSVRFVEPAQKEPVTIIHKPAGAAADSLFYYAFQALTQNQKAVEAFNVRQFRADAIQSQRTYLPAVHVAQLQGHYALVAPRRPNKDFAHLPGAPSDPTVQRQREAVAQADRERQALNQISLAMWYLDAHKLLNGGNLLPKTARDCLIKAENKGRTPRILDLGGLPTADWGWAMSLEHRNAKVYTAVVDPDVDSSESSEQEWTAHRAPSNHRTLTVSQPWSLPFPANSFDVISARTLHSLCRTTKPCCSSPNDSPSSDYGCPFAADFGVPAGRSTGVPMHVAEASDEYVATLAEIYRVLRPGGTLHYNFLDAELNPPSLDADISSKALPPVPSSRPAIGHRSASDGSISSTSTASSGSSCRTITPTSASASSSSLQARSVEFAVALRSRGLDPTSGHKSAVRLTAAGFGDANISESWLELPVGGVGDIRAVTEVVGTIGWERWLLTTKGERALEGMGAALEDARKSEQGMAWRMKVGVATK